MSHGGESQPASQCRVCGEREWRLVQALHDVRFGAPGQGFEVVRCRACGVMRTRSRNGPLDPGRHYPAEYGAFHAAEPTGSDLLPGTDHPPLLRYVASGRIAWLGRVGRRPGLRGLEVGCGSGRIALRLQRGLGWRMTGIEPSAEAAALARARGLEVHVGTLDDFVTSERFDLVLMVHVLEHLPDPLGALARARELLAPGGRLVIAVPNAESLERRLFGASWDGWDVPRHLHHFGPRSLRALLRRAGFVPGRVAHERYSLLGRSLANRFHPDVPFNERKRLFRHPRIEQVWGLLQATCATSSAIQVVAEVA